VRKARDMKWAIHERRQKHYYYAVAMGMEDLSKGVELLCVSPMRILAFHLPEPSHFAAQADVGNASPF
jgi:hypothetical protein